jgi:hypothetical protein
MNLRRHFKFAAIAIAMLAFAQLTYAQTAGDGKISNMTVGASGVRWDILVPNSGGSVTVSFPDGRSIRKAFKAGSAAEIDLSEKQLEGLPDGVYNYELRLAPSTSWAKRRMTTSLRPNVTSASAPLEPRFLSLARSRSLTAPSSAREALKENARARIPVNHNQRRSRQPSRAFLQTLSRDCETIASRWLRSTSSNPTM